MGEDVRRPAIGDDHEVRIHAYQIWPTPCLICHRTVIKLDSGEWVHQSMKHPQRTVRGRDALVSELMKTLTEKEWLQHVRDLAHSFGWKTYHTLRSKGSEPGFPDLVLVKASQLIFLELKSEEGRFTSTQAEWLYALGKVQHVHAEVVRPSQRERLEVVLSRGTEE